ncbi:MAG: hypothetical protein ACI4AK_07130 [Lepagella sp.]
MKITRYIHMPFAILVAMMIATITSCSDDVAVEPTPTHSDRWGKYVGQHFTKDSEDFRWRDNTNTSYKYAHASCIEEGEFVEFLNPTDSCITIRYGCEEEKKFNLAEITDNKIDKVIDGPYSPLTYHQYVDVTLNYVKSDAAATFFYGGSSIGPDIHISFKGAIEDQLYISKNLTTYDRVFLYSPGKDVNWVCDDYKFDMSSLKCRKSPLTINWSNFSWRGDLANLFPNPNDFLQLMLAMPVVKTSDYGFNDDGLPEYLSVERLLRILFAAFQTSDSYTYNYFYFAKPTPSDYNRKLVPYPSLFSVHYGGVDIMRIFIEAQKLKEIKYINTPATYMTLANVLRSMLLEERFYFDLQYRLEYPVADDDPDAMRALVLTVKEKESARHLMDYLIMPMLVENKQRIKDYIRQDAALSLHAETLCSAVDRLEEIYAGTTDLTLGYRMLCYPTTKEVSTTIWTSPEFE